MDAFSTSCQSAETSTCTPERQHLLITRGLSALKVCVPAPPQGDTFIGLLALLEDSDELSLTWHIDGSLFDELKRILRRTGFGIAAGHHQGSLIAFGYGVPPAWVVDAVGAPL